MHTISDYQKAIDLGIKNLEFPKFPPGLYEPVNYVINLGGKRIRPLLTLMAADLFDGKIDEALPAALAIEIFHNFTLVHDDLMDHADLRRGKPTVHRQWNNSTAVLSGDVMLVFAYDLLLKLNRDLLPDAVSLFNESAKKVCEGQELDMLYETQENVSLEEYTGMIGLKTATLLAGSLKMGALFGKSTPEEKENLYNFGYNAGMAFQVQDDLLDAYGTSTTFGKAIGGDIASNKKTFLTVKAFQVAEGDTRDELKYLFGNAHMDAKSKICEVLAIYDSLDIKMHAQKARDTYYQKAFQYLTQIKVPEEKKQNLKNLTEMLINREN
jgi:geranylgeranyl diphosphate synthase, type II